MRIYLDEDLASRPLTQLLRKAGHDIQDPSTAGLLGADDAVHLTYAIRNDCVCMSRIYRDFENLHNLVIAALGHHPGILVIRRDNDPKRNLTHPRIVQAIANILASGVSLADQCQPLNPWR
jgi:predicted nuclease of predicted toxin-antitoxin system